MRLTPSQMLLDILVIIIMHKSKLMLITLMEFQGNLSLERNHTGKTEMVLRMKNLMPMVILLHGVLVKLISIRKLNNLGLLLIIKEIRHQSLI